MSPDYMPPLNERVAALEPQFEKLESEMAMMYEFKDNMLKEITDLKASIKVLSYRVAVVTGLVIITGNKALEWGLKLLGAH